MIADGYVYLNLKKKKLQLTVDQNGDRKLENELAWVHVIIGRVSIITKSWILWVLGLSLLFNIDQICFSGSMECAVPILSVRAVI